MEFILIIIEKKPFSFNFKKFNWIYSDFCQI